MLPCHCQMAKKLEMGKNELQWAAKIYSRLQKKLTFRNCNYNGITNYSTVKLRRSIFVITQKLRTTNLYLRIVITHRNYVHTTYMRI